jgi:hypothetical protein
MLQRDTNPLPQSGEPTGASVIDLYRNHVKLRQSPRTLSERQHYLQRFAEGHGWRKVNDQDCLAFHLASWLDANRQWQSDWTLA